MSLLPTLMLVALLSGISISILLRQKLSLKREVLHLGKELEIQGSRIDYQKEQSSDSINYFSSAVIVITEMMRDIDCALKSEEGDISEKILEIIFEKTKNLFKPQQCILFKVDTAKKTFSRLNSFGYTDEELRSLNLSLDANDSFLGWSAASGRFLSFDDAKQDTLLSHLLENDPLGSHYAQPLKLDNEVKAVLCVGALSEEIEKNVIVRLFSIFSNIASVALSNALLTQELRELSIRDGLTGLYNHSYFQKWLENSLSNLKEKDPVLSLTMIDFDNFKSINDIYGHQAGDIILKKVSDLLNNLKARDYICARYGGEELALVFTGKGKSQTLSIIEDARKRISQKVFEIGTKQVNITISAGIAEARFSETEKINKRDLIESADQALYKAKAEGKNRVILA